MVGGLLHNTAQPHIRGHKDENMIEIFQSLLLDLCSCVTTTAQQQQQPGSLETFYPVVMFCFSPIQNCSPKHS